MPTPRKVNGNSKGEGGFKSPSMMLKWNFRRGGGFKLKNLPWEGYGYFLEQHIFGGLLIIMLSSVTMRNFLSNKPVHLRLMVLLEDSKLHLDVLLAS